MYLAARAAATALLIALAGTAAAQPGANVAADAANLRGDSAQTAKRLKEIKLKLETGSADAGDELQKLVDEVGDDLVPDGKRYVSARRAAHALLAQLPADALRAHRDRTEVPARALLDRAKAARDPRALWALVDRYPVSGPADEGLLLLGELLFERGEFRTAEGVWRRLLPDGGADVPYPGSRADLARVRALVALAAIYQNEPARAKELVAAFKAKHATAVGALAGKNGPYIEALEAQLASLPALPPDATAGAAWPTFGGAPDRAHRAPAGLPHFPARPTFTKALPDALARAGNAPLRPPFGYPVIAGGEVFVSDGDRVFAFDRTGEPSRDRYVPDPKLRDKPANEPEASAALTVSGGRLYARLGAHAVAPPPASGAQKADSYLVCLGLARAGKFVELWRLPPPESDRAPCAWEGAPLVHERRLWAVYTKFDAGRTVQVLACYDPADADQPPARPAWTVELCDAPAAAGRTRQDLLALAGRHVVFCSNSGAAIAVDAATGKRAWAVRYSRAKKQPAPSGDAAPALAHAGRVFLVPADGERALALDAETGSVLWESAPLEGARALGVSRDRLIVAASGPARGIRALDTRTGSHDDNGWIHETPDLLTYGQALVADNLILWPTRNGLFHLKPESGRPLFDPRTGPGGDQFFGHLACADGLLAVVTPTHLWLYEAESKKPTPADTPRERFDALYERAEVLARAGDANAALALFVEACKCAVPAHLHARAVARLAELAPRGALPIEVRAELLHEWLWNSGGLPVALGDLLDARAGKPPRALTLPDVVLPRKPCEAAFDPEAELAHEVALPPAVRPLLAIPGGARETRAFASGARAGLVVPFDRSAPRAFVPADLFTHAAELGDGFVCAGPFAVALYGEAKDAAWVFRVPRDGDAAPPHLGSFALAGRWLFARMGERHLIALDLAARRAAWVLCANGNAGYEPDARTFPNPVAFGPHFALTGPHLILQRTDGTRWFVSARTGKLPTIGSAAQTARASWPAPPEVFGSAGVLLPDGPGLVRLGAFGRASWSYEPDRTAGLTGEPAHARAFGEFLYGAVRRNHGVEFERIDPSDGTALWARGPAFADADRIDLRAADSDARALYVPAGNKLLAVCHETGRVKWEAELPAGRGWTAHATGAWVVCVPSAADTDDDFGDVLARCGRAFAREPLVARLPGLAVTLYDALSTRAAHARVLCADTGAPVRGFCVPARGPTVRAWCDAGALVIATGDRVAWFK